MRLKKGWGDGLAQGAASYLAHSWVLWFRPRPTCVVTLQQNTRSQSVSAGSFDQLCLDNKMSTSFWILHSNLVLQKASQLWELLLNTSNRVKACGQVLLSVWNGEWCEHWGYWRVGSCRVTWALPECKARQHFPPTLWWWIGAYGHFPTNTPTTRLLYRLPQTIDFLDCKA